MKAHQKESKLIYVHPILIALYPVLYLFASNLDEVDFVDVSIPLLFIPVVVLALFGFLSLVFRSISKGALLSSIITILFFSYGHVHELFKLLDLDDVKNFPFDRHQYLLPSWGLLFTILAFLLIKCVNNRRIKVVNTYFSIIAGFLLLMPICQIGIFTLNSQIAVSMRKQHEEVVQEEDGLTEGLKSIGATPIEIEGYRFGKLPDIYYIILDGYCRQDVMQGLYGYDNSEFIDYLKSCGFYVASKSRTNYPCTFLSLAASLNMKHMIFMTDVLGPDSRDRAIPHWMIDNNRVLRTLRGLGYLYVHFSSGIGSTDRNENADLEIICPGGSFSLPVFSHFSLRLTEFNLLLLRSTALKPLILSVEHFNARERTRYSFKELSKIPALKRPTFSFVHLICPHLPYVFGPSDAEPPLGVSVDGRIIDKGAFDHWNHARYVNQVKYVNRAISQVVKEIVAQSDVSPIIVIQADHGFHGDEYYASKWGKKEVEKFIFPIFNAYYFPHDGHSHLYPNITPVNTFRILFNYYFGANLPILEDVSYFSDPEFRPYDFARID